MPHIYIYIYMQNNKVFQNENESIEKIIVLSENKNKELQKKMKHCKKKRRFANKNKELQNINETEQTQ